MEDKLKGYKGKTKELLEKNKLGVWDIIKLKTERTVLEGIILPRDVYSAPNFIEIKLANNSPFFFGLPFCYQQADPSS